MIYWDLNDWWVGYYRGATHHYICPWPTVVIRWRRKSSPVKEVERIPITIIEDSLVERPS